MQLVIISGRSGSGKSIALQALEDLGFYTIDNLPTIFLPALLNKLEQHLPQRQRLAVCVDARNMPDMLQALPDLVKQLNQPSLQILIIYLTAESQQLLRRFSSTRRRHPLTLNDNQLSLSDAIALEETFLAPIRYLADLIIDTTQLTVHELRERIERQVSPIDEQSMSLSLISFGFKYGIPVDADMILDVRCLVNPYWQPELRDYSGLDGPVIAFLKKDPLVIEMLSQTTDWLVQWLPRYHATQRSYFTLAIGCTGGQHRSVYFIETLGKMLGKTYKQINVCHRELKQQRLLS